MKTKLNPDLVIQMRLAHKADVSLAQIAEAYGVVRRHAHDVVIGVAWAWVEMPPQHTEAAA